MNWLKTPWSLQSLVNKNESEWKKKNSFRSESKISRIELELLYAGEHPIRFSLSIAVLLYSLFILGEFIPPDWLAGRWHDWKDSEQLAYFSTLWSVQATIGALVYPIVIAFVTVFLQRRPLAEAFIHLYMLDSGGLAAGVSSLFLVLVMAIQYLLIPSHGAAALPSWVALDSVWFVLNSALTTYFLFRTVEFLRPQIQASVIRRYAINVSLPRDVRRLYLFQLIQHAQMKDWVPGPRYGDDVATNSPKVRLGAYGSRDGDVQLKIQLRESSRLINVRIWLLRLAVQCWLRTANKWELPTERRPMEREQWPVLSITALPGGEYTSGMTVLARVETGPPLSNWLRYLLARAFVFQPIKRERFGITVHAILAELETEARESVSTSNVDAFEQAYSTLYTLHILLLGASLVENDDEAQGSFALLPDTSSIFGRELHYNWANSYRSVMDAAIEAMTSNIRPVRLLCHLAQHLDSDALSQSPLAIRENVLRTQALLAHKLGLWWGHRIEEQGDTNHNQHSAASLRAPSKQIYEEAISVFCGGWENARHSMDVTPFGAKYFNWSSASTLGRLNVVHIRETALMLLAAIARGDRTASEWFADVLNKWWGTLSYEHPIYELYEKTDFITIDHLKLNWNDLAYSLGIKNENGRFSDTQVAIIQRGILLAALNNYWNDIRLLTVEILFRWLEREESVEIGNSLAMEIVQGILSGTQWRAGNSASVSLLSMTASQYLAAKIRQYASDGDGKHVYAGLLNQFVEAVAIWNRPNMISSRTYSGSGSDDVESLLSSQITLFATLSIADWKIGSSLRRKIEIWVQDQPGRIETVRYKLNNILGYLTNFGEVSHANHFKIIRSLLIGLQRPQQILDSIQFTKNGIESLKSFIDSTRQDAIDAEPVDPGRLKEIAKSASSTGFNSNTGYFPIQLFESINFTPDNQLDFTLTMNQFRKGELTRVLYEQPAINESEFWAESMGRQVGFLVLQDIFAKCNFREVGTPDAESYWSVLKQESEKIIENGETAILILGNATEPGWIWNWQYYDYGQEHVRPDDLNFERVENRGNSYVGDMNNIQIYVAQIPAGQSILISKAAFTNLVFKEFSEGCFAEAKFTPYDENKNLGDLSLKISRNSNAINCDAIRLTYHHFS